MGNSRTGVFPATLILRERIRQSSNRCIRENSLMTLDEELCVGSALMGQLILYIYRCKRDGDLYILTENIIERDGMVLSAGSKDNIIVESKIGTRAIGWNTNLQAMLCCELI
jgi:hypothetical protein